MSNTKSDNSSCKKGCKSCGDERVMLSEEKNSPPRCFGCGKPVPSDK